jgi:hypothetical protein
MQLYGTDLWVLAEVTGSTPRLMRLWRISLRGTPAAFLQYEVEIPDDAQVGTARAFAVTWRDTFMAWSVGGPYRATENYRSAGDSFVRTSKYAFGLLGRKSLLSVELDGVFPPGTSAELYYSLDGGDFVAAGSFTESGNRVVSIPASTRFFHNLQLELWPRTTIPQNTPEILSFGAIAYLPEYDRRWDLLLMCFDETPVRRLDGSQVPGHVGINHLFDLANSGEVVEFIDYYHAANPEDARIYMACVQSPRAMYVRKGEALVAVRISERGLVTR